MRIGELNQWVDFLHNPNLTQWENGDVIGPEAILFSCWAKVAPFKGTRRMQAEQIQDGLGYEVVTRFYPEIENTADHVIQWRGKRLKINGIPTNEAADFEKLVFTAYQEI